MTAEAPRIEQRAFHTHKPEYLTAMIVKSTLTESDKEIIGEFIEEKKGLNHILPARVQKIFFHLIFWRRCSGKDFEDLRFADVIKTMNAVRDSKKFNQNTYRDHIAIVKMFLRWLVDSNKANITEKDLKKIHIPKPAERKMRPADLLEESDKDGMIRACMSVRDKAIISLLWEGGLRPVEIGRLKADDIEFNHVTMYVHVSEKTGRVRKIPCPVSMVYIKQWIDSAPYEITGKNLVFCSLTPQVDENGTRHYLPMQGDSLRQQLTAIAKRAGVTKYRHPYQFRHTAITRFLDAGIPERQVMQISHGGDTRMMAIYYTPDDARIEDSINEKLHGLPSRKEREAKRQQVVTERICTGCGAVHDSNFRYCSLCGKPLTSDAKQEVKTDEDRLYQEYLSFKKWKESQPK